ncbi:hypothetical protein K8I61_00410 [bacterium]|nr:hypothetical protein [bacterium]
MTPNAPDTALTVFGDGDLALAYALLAQGAGAGRIRVYAATSGLADRLAKEALATRFGRAKALPRLSTASNAAQACAAPVLFLAVPLDELRGLMREIGEHLTGEHIVLHAVRGLAFDGRLVTASDVIRAECCVRKIGVLAGVHEPAELVSNVPAAGLVASPFAEVVGEARRLFTTDRFHAYGTSDLAGVEVGASLAPIYAIAAGIADGLGFGAASRAILVTRSVAEMARIAATLGADPATLAGLAGLGGIVAETYADGSPAYRYGTHRARSRKRAEPPDAGLAETLATIDAAARLVESRCVRAPILAAVRGVLTGDLTPAEAARRLIAREARLGEDLRLDLDDARRSATAIMPKGGRGRS